MTERMLIRACFCLAAFLLLTFSPAAEAACSNPAGVESKIVYNTSTQQFQYCEGNDWIAMHPPGSGSGGCSDPAFSEGTLNYNPAYRVMQGCAGNVWRAMGPVGGTEWVQVSTGWTHSCGIKEDGSAWCWGNGFSGRLGNGGTVSSATPVQVSGGAVWTAISVGGDHSCGIKDDGTLWCWGSSQYGQRGDGTTTATQATPVEISGGGTWKAVSAGQSHSCAIKSDDSAWCWGRGDSGQRGDGSTSATQTTPVAVSGGASWKAINAGSGHTCGIQDDDTAWCWGGGGDGRLGDGTTTSAQSTPVAVSGAASWKAVAAGEVQTCGIQSDDTAWCWGSRTNGVLGDGGSTSGTQTTPVAVSGGASWNAVSAGGRHTCGIKSDDSAWCWGWGDSGQLGDGSTAETQNIPVAVSGGGTWTSIEAGYRIDTIVSGGHTCGIKDGAVWCWGGGGAELGIGRSSYASVPVAVAGNAAWQAMANGADFSCGIKDDGSAWCWGNGDSGQLGNAMNVVRNQPSAVSGGATWKGVTAGGNHTCGIQSDDTAWCWGNGGSGRLGDGGTGSSNVPVAVSGGATWKMISAGDQHSCGIKIDDTAWCWGNRSNGRIGDGGATTGNQTTPIEVSGGATWKAISAGASTTCGIQSDDTAWCWGDGGFGQRGDGSTSGTQATPVEVSGGATWKAANANWRHSCGIKSDDTMWCWGSNNAGRLGNGGGGDQSVPVAVSGGGTWKSLGAASTGSHTCGVQSDDSAWCWGQGSDGQLGDGGVANSSVPVMVSGGASWAVVSTGGNHSCGIAAGSALCWGEGEAGQIGDGRTGIVTAAESLWCGEPGRASGTLLYNSAAAKMQYCDGGSWVGIGK